MHFVISSIYTHTHRSQIYQISSTHQHRLSHTITKSSNQIRCVVVTELLLFFRDVLFLPPFAIVIATLYRMPPMFLELLSRLAAQPLTSKPLFEVVRCQMECPEVGAPLLSFSLRVNKNKANVLINY